MFPKKKLCLRCLQESVPKGRFMYKGKVSKLKNSSENMTMWNYAAGVTGRNYIGCEVFREYVGCKVASASKIKREEIPNF